MHHHWLYLKLDKNSWLTDCANIHTWMHPSPITLWWVILIFVICTFNRKEKGLPNPLTLYRFLLKCFHIVFALGPTVLNVLSYCGDSADIFSNTVHVSHNLLWKICPLFGQILITCLKFFRGSFSSSFYSKKMGWGRGSVLHIVYQLNGSKNIYIFGNVIRLQIILRYKIPVNNDMFKGTSA